MWEGRFSFDAAPAIPSQTLANTYVLGIDFAKKFGMVMHLRDRHLWLADDTIIKLMIGQATKTDPETCKGIALLLDMEKFRLNQFLKRLIHKPKRQRNHRMSLKVCNEPEQDAYTIPFMTEILEKLNAARYIL